MSNNDLDQEYELYDERLIVRLQDKQLYSLVMSFMCIVLTTKNMQSTLIIITLLKMSYLYRRIHPILSANTYFFLFLGPRQFRNLPNIPFHFSCWDISNLDVIRTILSEWCLMDHHSEIHTHHTQSFSQLKYTAVNVILIQYSLFMFSMCQCLIYINIVQK